jgi:hypothetical protein
MEGPRPGQSAWLWYFPPQIDCYESIGAVIFARFLAVRPVRLVVWVPEPDYIIFDSSDSIHLQPHQLCSAPHSYFPGCFPHLGQKTRRAWSSLAESYF